MSTSISVHARNILIRSLPMVRQHKPALINQMARVLAADGTPGPDNGRIARALVELLFDQVHELVAGARPSLLERRFDDQRAPDIQGHHHSRFGDALVPALSDLLGPNVPREVPTAWCDAFWAIIRSARAATRSRSVHA